MNQYSVDELAALGVTCGGDVLIDRSVRFFGGGRVEIANHVRIDCFCLISAGAGGVSIGNHIHVAAGCYLFGGGGRIVLEDFCNLSSRVSLYTSSDDYVDGYLTNPTVPDEFRKVTTGAVVVKRHAIVGCGAVLLPGVTIGWGGSVGALTLVRRDVEECAIVFGNPLQKLPKMRSKARLLELEAEFLKKAAALPE
jgi:acetyltransferase-like isoleucine patch superfamily enzyme